METILISTKNRTNLNLLIHLAKKLGMKTRALSKDEIEDAFFLTLMQEGVKSGLANTNRVLRKLNLK